jgi:hypothetical protein
MADVSTPTSIQSKMAEKWALPRALMGGTAAMRAHGEVYLPKEVAETDPSYKQRLRRSTLFNAFRKTVKDMTGKVFQREVTLEKDVPAELRIYAEDIDLAGRHLNVFARDLFYDGLQTGITYILTDMPPPVERRDGRPATIADEQAMGARPYLCHIKCEDLIGWRSTTINGAEALTQVRIKECVTEPDGQFGEKEIEQIRVLMSGAWQTWRKVKDASGKQEWRVHASGTTSVNKITLAPVYINRAGFMCGEPPLEDLADLNVAHWQSQSDQRNILHVARVPILFGAGFKEDDKIVIGASSMTRNSDANATLSYIEHSGAAISAGDKDLQNLEFQMQTQGLQLLVPQPGGKTATGEVRDDAKENSPLAMMATALGDALEQSFGFMAEYKGMGIDKGGSVDVNTDFGVSIGAVDLQLLLDAVNAGQISKDTFWAELRRRDVLSDSFDPEAEKGRIEAEAPKLDAGHGKGMDLNGGGAGGPGAGAGA